MRPARLILEHVVGAQRRADRAAGVARRRLDPDAVETAVAQDLAVRDAVERDAARQAQLALAGLARNGAGHAQHDLLGHLLHRGGDVHVERGQELLRSARRLAEQVVERAVGHGQADAVIEVVEVEPERTVGLQVDQLVEDHPGIARLAVGREPHQLVFARIDLEAGVIGERRVQQPERMGEMDLLDDLEPVVAPERERAGRPLSDAVQRQYRCRGVRRRKKGAGGVA